MSKGENQTHLILKRPEFYRELFQNVSEGVVLTNKSGMIIEVNPSAADMFGYDPDKLVGKKVEVLVPTKRRAVHEKHRKGYMKNPIKRAMGSGMLLTAIRKDGSEFPVEISLSTVIYENEAHVISLITDISVRAEMQRQVEALNEKLEKKVTQRTRELTQSQYLYFTIARNFPDGTISVFDRDLNYIFFEGKELYRAGIDSAKILGTPLESRLPSDVRNHVIRHLKKVFSGESGVIEFETKGNYFEINAVPIQDNNKNIEQILVVERNITRQKRAEDDMLSALAKERTLNELKSRFVSMASHEFRTPLSTILSSISLIEKYNSGSNQEKIVRHIGRIKSSVQNLIGILNDFLSLDKLEAGKVRVNSVEFNVQDLIEDVMDELEAVLKKGQMIQTKFECAKDTLMADAHIVKNILINLTSNAIKYSSENEVIDLKVKSTDKELSIVVIDRGIGIPEEEQDQMYERFFRARNAVNIEGTGLGLNIVKKYVDLLGGTISFKSKVGTGTTFNVKLPLNGL